MKDGAGVTGRSRRVHDQSFMDDLVAQSLVPGGSVSAIAMEGGISANLLFKWRREHVRAENKAAAARATLLPVCVMRGAIATAASPQTTAVSRGAHPGIIELEIAGAQLRLRGAVDEVALSSVLRALRQSA